MRLTTIEMGWARAALQATFADRERGVRVPFERLDLEATIDETLRFIPWRSGMGLRIAIWMIALAPLWLMLRVATLTSLAAADRERVLARLIAHRVYFVRQLALLFKAFGALWVFRDAGLRAQVLGRGERLVSISKKKKESGHVAA